MTWSASWICWWNWSRACPPELPASLLQGAWGLLARLTGEDRAERTLDELFSGFCLGK